MLIPNRKIEREEPSRTAKKIFIFAEGIKREKQYFRFFERIDSRINLIICNLSSNDDNSPVGLFKKAEDYFNANIQESKIVSNFIPDLDEVWFIIDTDCWADKITNLRDLCVKKNGWIVSQSNPCFEVWFYYHFSDKLPNNPDINLCNSWKPLVNNTIRGGFDSRKHPVLLKKAIINSKKNYKEINGQPSAGSTELFKLMSSILPLIEAKLNAVLKQIGLDN